MKKHRVFSLFTVIFVAFLLFQSVTIVPTGYTGVKTSFGQIQEATIQSGKLNFTIPFVQSIHTVSNKQQDKHIEAQIWGEASDKTPVYAADVIVTYQVLPEKSAWLYANVSDTKNLVGDELVASAIKSAMAELGPNEVTNRTKIEPLAQQKLAESLNQKYKRVTWNIHGRKQIVWRCVNRIEYGTKFCGNSPSIPEEELHRAILKAVQDLAANFTDEVAAQINGILHSIQTGESIKPNLQEQLEQTQQEFDRLLEMSLDFDGDTPFLDDRLKKLNSKIKRLKKAIEETAAQQEKASQPEMLLSAKVLQIQEYDDVLTARIIEKITVRSRNEIEIRFIGGYEKAMPLE